MSGERDNRVSPVEIIHFKTIMKGLEILKKSGATQACQELQPSSWTNVEVKYLLFVKMRSKYKKLLILNFFN